MQSQYDLNLILNPNLSGEQLQLEKDYISNVVTNAGAEVTNLDDAGNRRMAYPIQKDREGYYLLYTIKAAGDP